VLPEHIQHPEEAVFWILNWIDALGAERVDPEVSVQILREASGTAVGIDIGEAVAYFFDGRRLVFDLELDRHLAVRDYTFDLIGPEGRRLWGWHGHPEPVGFHHRHDLPDFIARSAAPATFLRVAELVTRSS